MSIYLQGPGGILVTVDSFSPLINLSSKALNSEIAQCAIDKQCIEPTFPFTCTYYDSLTSHYCHQSMKAFPVETDNQPHQLVSLNPDCFYSEEMASKRNEADVENGGSTSDILFKEGGAGTDNFGSSFSDKVIRARFIRKVYAILLSQLAVTLVIVCACTFSIDIKNIYCDAVDLDDNGLWRCTRVNPIGKVIYWASYVVFFVTYM